MNKNEILNELNTICKLVFDNDSIEVFETTTAVDVDEWDSLTHIQLIVAIEKKFKIKFNSIEIGNFKNVGDLCQAIHDKIE